MPIEIDNPQGKSPGELFDIVRKHAHSFVRNLEAWQTAVGSVNVTWPKTLGPIIVGCENFRQVVFQANQVGGDKVWEAGAALEGKTTQQVKDDYTAGYTQLGQLITWLDNPANVAKGPATYQSVLNWPSAREPLDDLEYAPTDPEMVALAGHLATARALFGDF